MTDMTWKEFKDAIDAALKEAGKDDTETINYIDISYPDTGEGYRGVSITVRDGIEVLS
jgi:hypothetical protein